MPAYGGDGYGSGPYGGSAPLGALGVFSIDPDMTQPVRERESYLTDILISHKQHEQRICLRPTPRKKLIFSVLTDGRETALLNALLFGWQANIYGVPLWPDAVPLTADAAISDSTISLDTTARRFAVGGRALIWRDAFTHENAVITGITSGSITFDSTLTKDWNADGRTFVIPLLQGRLADTVTYSSPNNSATEAEFTFECNIPDIGPDTPDVGSGPLDAAELFECDRASRLIYPDSFTGFSDVRDQGTMDTSDDVIVGTSSGYAIGTDAQGSIVRFVGGPLVGGGPTLHFEHYTLPGDIPADSVRAIYSVMAVRYYSAGSNPRDPQSPTIGVLELATSYGVGISGGDEVPQQTIITNLADVAGGPFDPTTFDFAGQTIDARIDESVVNDFHMSATFEVRPALLIVWDPVGS